MKNLRLNPHPPKDNFEGGHHLPNLAPYLFNVIHSQALIFFSMLCYLQPDELTLGSGPVVDFRDV